MANSPDLEEDFPIILRLIYKCNPRDEDIVNGESKASLVWKLKELILHAAGCTAEPCQVRDQFIWARNFNCTIWREKFKQTSSFIVKGIHPPASSNLGINQYKFIKLIIENHISNCVDGCNINICKIYHVARFRYICGVNGGCHLCHHSRQDHGNEVGNCHVCCIQDQANELKEYLEVNLAISINFDNFKLPRNLIDHVRVPSNVRFDGQVAILPCQQRIHLLSHGEVDVYNYDGERSIGTGAYASVHSSHTSFHRIPIARKQIDLLAILDEEKRISTATNTVREIEAIRKTQCKSEYVIKIYGAETTQNASGNVGGINIFMQLMCCTLREFIQNNNFERMGLESGHVRHLLAQMCSGLKYLHSEGMWHMDIKTKNLLVDARAIVLKLADFNLVHIKIDTQRGEFRPCGSLNFIAPELLRLRSGRPFSERADIFSAGACLIEMLGGGIPRSFLFKMQINTDLCQRIRSYSGTYSLPAFKSYLTWEKALYTQMLHIEPSRRPSARTICETLADPSKYHQDISTSQGTRIVDIFLQGSDSVERLWMHSLELPLCIRTLHDLTEFLNDKFPYWKKWHCNDNGMISLYDHENNKVTVTQDTQTQIDRHYAFLVHEKDSSDVEMNSQ